MKRLETCPKTDGFRMPAEFEEHAGTYMIWPERPDNWRNGAKPAKKVFTEVANTIGQYDTITVCVSDSQNQNARGMLDEYVKVGKMSKNEIAA